MIHEPVNIHATRLRLIREAAKKWCDRIPRLTTDANIARVKTLAEAAFLLYVVEWPHMSVADWQWPHDELNEPDPFSVTAEADEPWYVLFRRAYRIAAGEM